MLQNRELDDEAQLAIELASLCKSLGTLPREGGLLDQSYHHIILIRAGLEAIAAYEEFQMKKASKN